MELRFTLTQKQMEEVAANLPAETLLNFAMTNLINKEQRHDLAIKIHEILNELKKETK
jgi:hypothetical protein